MGQDAGIATRELTDAPPLPEELRYVWDWYWELCGPDALTNAEILAWCQLTRTRLFPWEVRLLRSLDRARMRIMNHDD